jgi:DNA polymerase elongation subunit (family B)
MSELPPYKPRKQNKIAQSINEPIEFLALDWYECDLLSDAQIERKSSYLNQEHNKSYTIFIFGITSKGHSICLRVKNYLPYFYVQIPDDFNSEQTNDFLRSFDSANIEDYDEDELEQYTESITKRDYKFAEDFKRRCRYYVDAVNIEPQKTKIVEKKIFWTFMNEQKFNFAKIAFKSKVGYQFMEKAFKTPMKLPIKDKHNTTIKYNLFESDLEPVLRFMHDKKIKPSSWLQIAANKYKIESKQSKTQINISCDWNELFPLDKAEIPPLLIASFDIEADSSHGDFPLARKDCKKFANQLVITWIRDQRVIEKRTYEKILSSALSKTVQTVNSTQSANAGFQIPEDLRYVDKKNTEYDNQILPKLQEHLLKLQAELQQQDDTLQPTKEIVYLREVIKYIKAKNNIAQNAKFYDYRIKKSLGYEQYATIDDEVELIYLKHSVNAKMFTKKPEYKLMIDKIFTICNRPIRKVKANTIMKKAQNEVTAIETAKLNKSTRFNLDDLIKIINEVARKYKIPERDLQDKMITKETMVRFVNNELNRAFGFAKGDTVIQIGTVFWRYGESSICHNNIITLKSCSQFDVGGKPCEIIAREEERDVLLEWAKLIDEHDPDIIIGYNTFGFDESFMYDRITDIAHDVDRLTLTKEDLKALETNLTYQKFINLGRFEPEIIKKVPDAKGGIVNKKLSSSALGDNFMYYFNMPGRVQIDLLKVCQASLTKLPSYKLDSVSEFYISGKIKDIIVDAAHPKESCKIKVDNVQELEVGNYIVISMSSTTAKLYDGDKLKIIAIDKEASKVVLDKPIPKSCLASVPLWGLGKDDISPQDIFRLQKGSAEDRALIAKYCIQDCALLIRLLRKLEVINNNFGMSNVCLVPFSYIFLRGQGIKAFSLITNECAKEDFLLPVLEKIEPDELEIDDKTRQTHTQFAARMEQEDDGDDLLEENTASAMGANAQLEAVKSKAKVNGGDANTGSDDANTGYADADTDADESDDEDGSDTEPSEPHPSTMRFKMQKNFNQIIMNDESYEGALVLKPVTDIYTEDPITVLDFSSLYPSEMITSDLSHDRICEDPYWLGETGARHLEQLGLSYLDRSYDNYEWIDPKKKSKGKRKCGITTVRFVQYPDNKKGLIPRILMGLLASRKATKKKMDAESDPFKKALYDGLQLAYKVTANSVYGQIGARTSKMFKPQIAAATTAGGRLRLGHAKSYLSEKFPGTKVIYGDTDSNFFRFRLLRPDGTPPETDQEKIALAIQKGQEAEKELKKVLPGVHCMAYEKVLFPFILISKKRYFALKYEDDPTKCKPLSMGLILKRRDNAPILKHCYIGVLDSLVKERSIPNAIKYVQDECKKMIDGKFDMNMFVISKTLSSYYADPESIAHKILADRMAERDPGNKPQSNERIPYVFIKIKEEPGIDYLQGDRIEHINYVRQHKLKPDYEKYILNQIMKPVSQLFELVIEKLPNFPYGRGYYDELYNIWYNKYDGDELKTEKKIKQLKAQMVQKLIFDPLVHYARIKGSNIKTIDEWFRPPVEGEGNDAQEQNAVLAQPKGKKVQIVHEVKIKKSKQMSLDAFLT